jgi:hypothetical protein
MITPVPDAVDGAGDLSASPGGGPRRATVITNCFMANAFPRRLLLSPFNESGGSRLQKETESVSRGYSRRFWCLVLFLTIVGLAPGQTLLQYFDLGTYGTACCMATDVNGDVYVVGSVGSNQLAGKVIAMKVDRTNNVVYQFTFGGSRVDAPKAVAVDAEGNSKGRIEQPGDLHDSAYAAVPGDRAIRIRRGSQYRRYAQLHIESRRETRRAQRQVPYGPQRAHWKTSSRNF